MDLEYMEHIAFATLWAINTVLILLCIQREYRLQSPFVGFWVLYLAGYHLYAIGDWGFYWHQPHPAAIEVMVDQETLLQSQQFILAVTFSMVLAGLAATIRTNSPVSEGRGNGAIRIILLVYFVRIAFKLAEERYRFSFEEIRENSSIISLIFDVYLKYFVIGIAAYLFYRKKYLLTISILSAIIADFFLFGGARQHILITGLAMLVLWLMLRGTNVRIFIIVVTSLPILVWIPRILVFLRNLPTFEDRFNFLIYGDWGLVVEGTSEESQLRFALYHFMHELPDELFHYQYIERILLFWLPSSLAPWKPEDFEYVMYAEMYNGASGTFHATWFGTIYADTGWNFLPWVLLFFIARFTWSVIRLSVPDVGYWVLWLAFFYLSVMWARGSVYAPIVVVFFIAAVVILAGAMRRKGQVEKPQAVSLGAPSEGEMAAWRSQSGGCSG